MGHVLQRLKATNQPVAAFHVELGLPDGEEARLQLRAVCRLARVATVPLVSISAAEAGSDFEAEIARLQEWNRIAESEGVILSVETHSGTITADLRVRLSSAAECQVWV